MKAHLSHPIDSVLRGWAVKRDYVVAAVLAAVAAVPAYLFGYVDVECQMYGGVLPGQPHGDGSCVYFNDWRWLTAFVVAGLVFGGWLILRQLWKAVRTFRMS